MLLVALENGMFAIHRLRPPEFAAKADLHYAAVGSGGIYGQAAFMIQQYSKSSKVTEALFQVYSATKATEIVYGVGEPTKMAVLTKNGISDVSSQTISLIERFRMKRSRYLLTAAESKELKELIPLG